MQHYNFTEQLHRLYSQAIKLCSAGQRGPDTYFTADETAFLTANGLTAQNLYDYAEDELNGGEPGWEIALSIELIRRDYFLNIQGGKSTGHFINENELPGKSTLLAGLPWLARLIPKAQAKLRGELPPSMMYACGGDRAFFQQHGIQPAEFLSIIWRHESNHAAISDWVHQRSRSR